MISSTTNLHCFDSHTHIWQKGDSVAQTNPRENPSKVLFEHLNENENLIVAFRGGLFSWIQ